MAMADQDSYFAQMAQVGQALGADPVPHSRRQANDLLDAMRPNLRCDARTREIARLILTQPAQTIWGEPIQALTMDAGIDLLPPWAIELHRLHPPTPDQAAGPAGYVAGSADAAVGVQPRYHKINP